MDTQTKIILRAIELLESLGYMEVYNSEEAQKLYYELWRAGYNVDISGGVWDKYRPLKENKND